MTQHERTTHAAIRLIHLRAGLCHPCSHIAADGHLHGFDHLPQPCGECRPVVSGLSEAEDVSNGWRRLNLNHHNPERNLTR